MNLFQQFAPLIASGVTVHMKLSAHGEKVQLDLIPVAKENKAGISLMPKALVATAAELDEKLPGFLEGYLATQVTLSDLIDKSQLELKAAEDAAKSLADAAKSESAKSGSKSSPAARATSSGAPKRERNLTDGLMGEGDELPSSEESSGAAETVSADASNEGSDSNAEASVAGGLHVSLF